MKETHHCIALHCSKCYDSDSAKYGMLGGHQIWAFNPEKDVKTL